MQWRGRGTTVLDGDGPSVTSVTNVAVTPRVLRPLRRKLSS